LTQTGDRSGPWPGPSSHARKLPMLPTLPVPSSRMFPCVACQKMAAAAHGRVANSSIRMLCRASHVGKCPMSGCRRHRSPFVGISGLLSLHTVDASGIQMPMNKKGRHVSAGCVAQDHLLVRLGEGSSSASAICSTASSLTPSATPYASETFRKRSSHDDVCEGAVALPGGAMAAALASSR